MTYIADYLLIYKNELSFYNKKKLRNLLRFFLRYLHIFGVHRQIDNFNASKQLSDSTKLNLLKNSTIGWVKNHYYYYFYNIQFILININKYK